MKSLTRGIFGTGTRNCRFTLSSGHRTFWLGIMVLRGFPRIIHPCSPSASHSGSYGTEAGLSHASGLPFITRAHRANECILIEELNARRQMIRKPGEMCRSIGSGFVCKRCLPLSSGLMVAQGFHCATKPWRILLILT